MFILVMSSVSPRRLILAAISLLSPSIVSFTISCVIKRAAALSIRSSLPSGSTMCFLSLLAHLANWYRNMCGVMLSDRNVTIFSSSALVSTYLSNTVIASSIFLLLSGVMRDWIAPTVVVVSKVPVPTAIIGTMLGEPSISRIMGASGTVPAVS